MFDESRFNFMREARIWYSWDSHQQPTLPGGFANRVTLSDDFYKEVVSDPIPADLDAVKSLSASPAALDFFLWLSYRCYQAKGEERVPLFGYTGLANQLGSACYARPRRFREKVQEWLDVVVVMWPQCPAQISSDGSALIVAPAHAVSPKVQL